MNHTMWSNFIFGMVVSLLIEYRVWRVKRELNSRLSQCEQDINNLLQNGGREPW